MKFNKKAVCSELDKQANEFDELGFADLADELDYYNDKLMNIASEQELNVIVKALSRIDRDAEDRITKKEKKALEKNKNVDATKEYVRKARIAKMLKEHKAKKYSEKIKKELQKKSLREGRKKRLDNLRAKIDKKKRLAVIKQKIEEKKKEKK